MAETIKDTESRKIKELVEEMKLYNNPQELEDMKKTMKKNVPFMMRGYLLAYLYVTRGGARTARPERQERQKPQQTRPVLENATSFYINVGQTSRTSAKELAEFVCEKAGLEASDILSVAYKQNYSFVYIRNDKTEGVIEKVTGQTYNGRKVKMNYSKEKDEQ